MTTISNKVRYYHSAMPNAPVLSGTAGALISVLDACLVNGFDSKSINSLTVTDGIAVAQISAGHSYGEGDVLRIAGATPAKLNSDWRLASVTANSVTFSVEGVGIPDGAASGTITALRAPAGWEKVFADGTTRAAYRSLDYAAHNGLILYVDDTGTTVARAYGYESMTDIDTGVARFPDTVQAAENWWGKSSVADATSRAWTIVADAKRFTFCPRFNNSYPKGRPFCFGLLLHAAGVDPWATFINGAAASTAAAAYNFNGVEYGDLAFKQTSQSALAGALARGLSAAAPTAAKSGFASAAATDSGGSGYPVAVLTDTPPVISSLLIAETTYVARGYFPTLGAATNKYEPATSPRGTVSGAPGNGLHLEYSSSGTAAAFFLHLGVDGRWD